MPVDFLFADFDTHIVDHGVPDVVCPVIRDRIFRIGCVCRDGGQVNFEKNGAQEIGAAGDQRADTATKIERAVHFDRNTFDGKGCIAAVDMLEECELRIGGQVGILATFGHKL